QKKDKYAFRLVQAMRTQSVYANREIERLRAEVATVHLLREQISDAMTAARARADKAIEQISHEMTATQARADEAIRTVFNTVYGSTSWRVTAPLRRMSAWLRGR
ncbi:MAG: hypothetical protein QOH05_4448, partial [Acetobacteraceae bacterium]|nr:hypothetical protein [Acetobacteraceae bacterium]